MIQLPKNGFRYPKLEETMVKRRGYVQGKQREEVNHATEGVVPVVVVRNLVQHEHPSEKRDQEA